MKLSLLFVLATAVLAHGAGLRNGFVYDDHRFVAGNTRLAQAHPLDLVLDVANQTADGDLDVYRPLRALGHRIDLEHWGLEPFGFHLHSLLVHVLNVALAWALLRRLLPAAEPHLPALLGATVLAAHPLGVEAVGWISSRGDLYAVGFGLLALGAFLRSEDPSQRRRWLVACAALAFAATLGKEAALAVPLVAWAAWRLLRRGAPSGVVMLALGAGGALALRQWVLRGASPVQTAPHGGDAFTQVGWALYGLGRMLGHLLLPGGLSIDYPQDLWARGPSVWIRPATAAGALVVSAPFALWTRATSAAFGLSWLLLAYLPSSSLGVTLRTLVADRYAYPVLAAAGALLGLALARRPRLGWAAAVALAATLVPLASARTAAFHDDASLWGQALAMAPSSIKARLALADAALAHDQDSAEAWLRAAVAQSVSQGAMEGATRARLGDFLLHFRADAQTARPQLEQALGILRSSRDRDRPGPDEAVTAANLAEAYTRLGLYAEAEAVMDRALAEHHGRFELLLKLALLRLMRADREHDDHAWQKAREALEPAVRMAPRDPRLQAALRRLAELERR